jgi:thiamine pyrophosphokinase
VDNLVFIITGGPIQDLAWLRSRIDESSPEAIICADSGALPIHALGLIPQMIVGDMDSLPPDLLQALADKGAVVRRYPPAKDETDTELAFEAAMELHPEEIWVFGALGNRLDHTLANLALLLKGEARRVRVKLVDEWCEVFLVTGMATLEGEAGQTVSFLPFLGDATSVTLSGFEYPLDKKTMFMETPFGISNRLTGKKATISMASGRLIAIRYFHAGIFPL